MTPSGVLHIRVLALERENFPNSEELQRYVQRHGQRTEWRDENAYMLTGVDRLLDIPDIILGEWMDATL